MLGNLSVSLLAYSDWATIFSILSALSRPKLADQLECLGGRALFEPTVFTAVSGPAHHAVVAEPSSQQGMVTEKVIVV